MKSVMISIKAKWCKLIDARLKDLDIRKSCPKEVPFNNEIVYSDKVQFEEDLTDWLADQVDENISEEEFNKMVKAKLEKYKPYWKKCICIWVSN